ncbi:peptidase M23 [Streptomyces venezuelae]|uniref:peptidase M23 n=1 Tax=Streptomyces venezuelae TaxID=54571 RepID=UPI00343DA048
MAQRDTAHVALQVARMGKSALGLKLAVLGAVLFLIGLMVLGMASSLPAAAASSCEDSGPGTGSAEADDQPAPQNPGTEPGSGIVRTAQLNNAKAIDKAAQKLGLPGKATLIGLMTALQESTLQNINHGPPGSDALGLFQQRPSQDWGTKKQIMTPSYAARSFFAGHGTNIGLSDIANWQKLPMHVAAEKVQRSGEGGRYAGRESEARAIAKEAHLDLDRAGKARPSQPKESKEDQDAATGITGTDHCGRTEAGGKGGGKGGGTFTDGKATWQLNNPRSVTEAIAWAKANSGANSTAAWHNRCLALTAIIYGWSFSGVQYAIDHYTVVPASMRHDGDRHPPPGALMYWDTGHRAGHIAVYIGNGKIVSNDVKRNHYVDIVPADAPEKQWGARYVGWTPPVFPRGG